jgi:hypothetical protein
MQKSVYVKQKSEAARPQGYETHSVSESTWKAGGVIWFTGTICSLAKSLHQSLTRLHQAGLFWYLDVLCERRVLGTQSPLTSKADPFENAERYPRTIDRRKLIIHTFLPANDLCVYRP